MSARRLVPEVIQTSGMDCGPAALTALLAGFHLPVSYARLREACQTDVDGTSISAMEEVATQLGLACEEVMLPADHVLLPEAHALPAIVVIRTPSGVSHFVVVWSVVGPFVQVMDPAVGRRWLRRSDLLDLLYKHSLPVPAADWREWAGDQEFQATLHARLRAIGGEDAAALSASALADPSWGGLARLDAATRMVASVVAAGGLRRGAEAHGALVKLVAEPSTISPSAWSVQPTEPDEEGDPQLLLRGAVLVRASGRADVDEASLGPELRAALSEPEPAPLRSLGRYLAEDGLLAPAVLVGALAVSAITVLLEALLLRGLLELGTLMPVPLNQVGALAAVITLVAVGVFLELQVTRGVLDSGRALDARLRLAFMTKLPRLPDHYFQSRLISDMAERSHATHLLRRVPQAGQSLLQGVARLVLTTAGIIWLAPAAAPLALLAAVVAVGLPLLCHPLLAEQDLRQRAHLGALSRFYLDALLGLAAIRSHGAERALRREHAARLVEWGHAGLSLQRTAVLLEGLIASVGLAVAASLVALFAADQGGLLLIYWALALPAYGQQVAVATRQYPAMRSVLLRLLEPLLAPESASAADAPGTLPGNGAVAIQAEALSVVAGGQTILNNVNINIPAGCHVAIVGSSGSGKSSLAGLLLGWHRPASGTLSVNQEALDPARVAALRRCTAWVDPEVQLWNRSLLDNLRYGAPPEQSVAQALQDADLMDVLDRLPDGLQTSLGEGGGRLSGGQGQRVRLGRALSRGPTRLAILDEPFRGLDRDRRRALLGVARRHWRDATLLCITHDIDHTLGFDQVLVVEDGRVVEAAPPAELLAGPSRYRQLMDAEAALQGASWAGMDWRNVSLNDGILVEDQP